MDEPKNMRILFRKGEQRKFIGNVLEIIGCPSLRRLKERGIDVNYQTMKAYYNETRTLPEQLFLDLCKLAGINHSSLGIRRIDEHWGQIIGGKR
jgi:hypothetical protein